jgi:hypothetical protein
MTAEEQAAEAADPLPVPGLDWPNRPGTEDYQVLVGS